MRKIGLVSVAPKPNSSRPASGHRIYPYPLRELRIQQPDQVWCADITYIRMPHGFVYLTAVMDWYSRYVLAWEVSVTMEEAFCVSPLESALRRHGCPRIFNIDQRGASSLVNPSPAYRGAWMWLSVWTARAGQ